MARHDRRSGGHSRTLAQPGVLTLEGRRSWTLRDSTREVIAFRAAPRACYKLSQHVSPVAVGSCVTRSQVRAVRHLWRSTQPMRAHTLLVSHIGTDSRRGTSLARDAPVLIRSSGQEEDKRGAMTRIEVGKGGRRQTGSATHSPCEFQGHLLAPSAMGSGVGARDAPLPPQGKGCARCDGYASAGSEFTQRPLTAAPASTCPGCALRGRLATPLAGSLRASRRTGRLESSGG